MATPPIRLPDSVPLPVTIPHLGPILLPSVETALGPLLLQAVGGGASPFDALADLADALPAPLRGPDATPSVPTGASDIARADAFTYAALAAAPRLIETLGPGASGVVAGDETFAIAEVYNDPVTGFEAVQLRSLSDGRAVFAVDGTDFNSQPDVVADLDLARPQVASPAFAAMVADARAAALAEGREVAFTGASLGGALVQVAGYETAEAIHEASPGSADRVTVFGVDPLGGRDAAEGLNGGALDPAVLERLNAISIRTEGDIVSRVGSQSATRSRSRPWTRRATRSRCPRNRPTSTSCPCSPTCPATPSSPPGRAAIRGRSAV
jgi:hypothetical protein